MGWCASADWSLTFRNEEAIRQCAEEILPDSGRSPREIVVSLIEEFHEDSDVSFDGTTLNGWGGGKAHISGNSYALLANHCEGIVDWHSDEGDHDHWRVRFRGGIYREYAGIVMFPDDPMGNE